MFLGAAALLGSFREGGEIGRRLNRFDSGPEVEAKKLQLWVVKARMHSHKREDAGSIPALPNARAYA